MSLKYITQKVAQQIDDELMSASGAFSLDQLMELAGLSCAQALAKTFPLPKYRRVLVCCGPGNQGGDGLVAARHLHHLAYAPVVYLPKPGTKDIYARLLAQVRNLGLPVVAETRAFEDALRDCDVVLDAIFGFSFHPPVRKPFDAVLRALAATPVPILSVDIPSGWDVERGEQELRAAPDLHDGQDEAGHAGSKWKGKGEGVGEGRGEAVGEVVPTIRPEALISLTIPKLGVKEYKGRHWLGGRFVPPDVDKKFGLNVPKYEGLDQVVDITELAART
ncbi:hypothetical protein Q5752_007066 [Cryptotrichosporon argae]